MDLEQLLVVGGAAAPAAGAAIDHFSYIREKYRFHDRLIDLFFRLYDTRIPNYPLLAAEWIHAGFARLFGPRIISWRFFLSSIVASWILTTMAYVLARAVQPELQSETSIPLLHAGLYVVNWGTDVLTLLLAKLVLLSIPSGSPLRVSSAFLAYLAGSFVLAIVTVFMFIYVGSVAIANRWPATDASRAFVERQVEAQNHLPPGSVTVRDVEPLSVADVLDEVPVVALALVSPGWNPFIELGTWTVEAHRKQFMSPVVMVRTPVLGQVNSALKFCALTTFLPTLMLFGLLVLMLTMRALLLIVRRSALRYLEVTSERNPKVDPTKFRPATLLGVAVGLSLLLLRCVLLLT